MSDQIPTPDRLDPDLDVVAKVNEDRAANAEQIFEQFKMMWDDEVGHAATIQERRKLFSAGIGVLLGLGAIRVSWYRSTRDVPAVASDWQACAIKALIAVSIASLFLSAWFLLTDRRTFRPAIGRAFPKLGGKAWFHSDPDLADRKGRAIQTLDIDHDEVEEQLNAAAEKMWLRRAWDIRAAYEQLAKANARVNNRIKRGVLAMGISLGILALAIVWYTFALDRRVITNDYSPSQAGSSKVE